MLDIGDRLPKLGRRAIDREAPAERRLHALDRFFDQRLAGEVIERVALPDPGQLAGSTVGRLDHHVVVAQAGKGGAISLNRVDSALEDARDDFPRFE